MMNKVKSSKEQTHNPSDQEEVLLLLKKEKTKTKRDVYLSEQEDA